MRTFSSAATSYPWPRRHGTSTQVEPVVDAEVRERREVFLVDRVPQPQLGGDPAVEVAQHVEPVRALGRRGQAEQLERLQVLEQRLVRGRRRVVELVDDDDVEVRRVDVPDVGALRLWIEAKTCSNREGRCPPTHFSPKRAVAQRVAEGRAALVEDLLAVRDEEQAAAAELRPQARVVDRRHHRLARAGGSDEQVAMVALVAGEVDVLEKRLLERAELELDRARAA